MLGWLKAVIDALGPSPVDAAIKALKRRRRGDGGAAGACAPSGRDGPDWDDGNVALDEPRSDRTSWNSR